MSYVDGFVAPVPNDKKQAFIDHAAEMAELFKEHGALQVVDCWAHEVPDGEVTSFPMAVKCQDGESVVFSWIVWPSHAVRAAAWEKLREDPRMMAGDMPFDGKRLIYGGFEPVMEV